MQLVDSPIVESVKTLQIGQDRITELLEYSIKNRMALLFLDSIAKKGETRHFATLYNSEKAKHLEALRIASKVSASLTEHDISHAVFKTLRPYIFTTADIDVIIFDSGRKYSDAVEKMQRAGYELVIRGPRSTTLKETSTNIGIDLYEDVAVSLIIYLDKEKLAHFVTTVKRPDGNYIKTLRPEADLLSMIAHSILKEQIYTLSEYYSFIYHLEQIDVDDFIELVKQTHLICAVRTHITLTALLHKIAHKSLPIQLRKLLTNLGEDPLERASIIKNNFKTPHKYHVLTIAQSLLEIAKEEKCRDSYATQIMYMLSPNFARKFLRDLMKHVTRETY